MDDPPPARLVRLVPDARLRLERDAAGWRVTYAADAVEAVTGRGPGEFARGGVAAWLDGLHPDDRTAAAEEFRRLVDSARPAGGACYRVVRPGGQVRWVAHDARVERDGDGRAVAIDVRLADDLSARDRDDWLGLLTEAADLGTWDYQPGTGRVVWSDRLRQMFGVPEGVPDLSAWFLEHLHPADRDRVHGLNRGALDPAGPGRYDAEYTFVRPDGVELEVAARGRAYFAGTGPDRRAVRFFGVVQDVTARRRAERDRADRERFVAAVLAAFPGLVYVYDLKGERNVFLAGRSDAVLGYTPDEVRGMGPGVLATLLHPDDRDRVAALHGRFAAAADGEVLESEYRMRDRAGRWRDLHSRETVFRRDAAGSAVQMLGAALDITELRESERRVRDATRQLIDVQERERRHLAAELHDEVGQLLTAVMFALEAPGNLAAARGLVRDIAGKVRDLSLALRPGPLDDLGLVPALLWLVGRFSESTRVRVDLRHRGADRRFSPEVETAAYRIVQEALTNAARHAGCEEIRVLVTADRLELTVEVADEGRGFDPKAVRERGGTAGLAGMRERAAGLGGRLDVDAAPGRGTIIRAVLPLERGERDGDPSTGG